MDARELRIGNFIMYSGVVEVNENSIVECVDHPTRYGAINIINDEWLLKFGFTRSDYNHYSLDDFRVELENQNAWYFGDPIPSVDINQVHQLQNIYFALTGEELTIK
tara:strand:- start:978 stop:1298 length:321 start_codon:yes stop_codon:yes gene_type:complete